MNELSFLRRFFIFVVGMNFNYVKFTQKIEYPELNFEEEYPISRIDGAWRIVVPEKIREVMNLKPGDYIAFTEENGRIVLRKPPYTESNPLRLNITFITSHSKTNKNRIYRKIS